MMFFVDSKLRDEELPSHEGRHGNTERQRIYHALHVPSKKAKKHAPKSILHRFLNSPRYRESQINIGWNEEHCARDDAIAAEDHSHIATASERFRRENAWVLCSTVQVPTAR